MGPEHVGCALGVQPDPADGGGQVEVVGRLGVLREDLRAFDGVETGVENRRVEVVVRRRRAHLIRHDDFRERAVVATPDVLQMLEVRAELVTGLGVLVVVFVVVVVIV